jgi:thiamine-monophosphate kinase
MVLVTGEFAAIESIRNRLGQPSDGSETWIGDDAAVLAARAGGWLLLAADSMVAGVHADLALTGLDDFGWKAMVASVSDIAAMGGRPGHALVTVAGPQGTDLDRLYDGLAGASSLYECPIVGGDLTNAGALVVTVAVTGHCEGRPVLRRGARPGDGIWVTGDLGAAAAGLRLLRAGEGFEEAQSQRLHRAHARPTAHVEAGTSARRAGATAMIDVSDGLAADLGHIADASGVGFRLESLPVAAGATLEEALGGGEDFVLAFCAPDTAAIEEAFRGLDTPFRVGRCTEDVAERTLDGRTIEAPGWEHQW